MAELVCFPQHRNLGKARHVAERYLSGRSERDREIYWRTTKKRLIGVLERLGFSDHEIAHQIHAFTGAVQDQIDIIHHFEPLDRGSDGGPGAA